MAYLRLRVCPGYLWLLVLFFAGMLDIEPAWSQDDAARPNILWITSEDNASHWLGCYGNVEAKTPRLDELASNSVLFTHAYSNAAVCAVARSTILHGTYATTLGTQHMRSRYAIPTKFRPYVSYLQERGYYCTNNSKTDYNRKGNDREIWDECGANAHYKNRRAGQPFFAIFNFTVSHESALFPKTVVANRRRGVIPEHSRLNIDALQLPPHLPDLPEVRRDVAIYHDYMTALDGQVANVLDELERSGLAQDTIVFYYSDHGGPTPRGKRYLTDTGVHVPLIVHFPEKWKRLSIFPAGSKVDELVSFVDLAPTLLSLCGIETPPQMQGRAFLGTQRVAPPETPMVFLYADRFDEVEGMRRGLTDGRFKYIRRFMPHLPAAPNNYYCFSMPSWLAWRRAWQEDRLPLASRAIWEAPQPVEQFYDLKADPWEVRNLANDPTHANHLREFRTGLRRKMAATKDIGIVPEAMFQELAGDGPMYDFVNSAPFDHERVLDMAFQASEGDLANLPSITRALSDRDPVIRYWATLGVVILGNSAAETESQLVKLLDDTNASVRITAASALHRIGKPEAAKAALLAELNRATEGETTVMALNTISFLRCENDVPQSWIDEHLQGGADNDYVQRIAVRLAAERKQ